MGGMKTSMHEGSWRDLYRAALSEPDKSKSSIRIANAEKKIAARAREIANTGDQDALERSELNVASYALVALRNWLDWNANERAATDSAVA
jgi:hypothetical protein